MRTQTILIAAAVLMVSCSARREGVLPAPEAVPVPTTEIRNGSNSMLLPPVIIYKMSGDYAENVPVTLNADGTKIVSYPAPSDVSVQYSTPLPLVDGFWLDRRGVSDNTVFTLYTYKEYASLPSAPTPEELMAEIIPGARVTETIAIPRAELISPTDTADINAWIRRREAASSTLP